MIGKMERKRIFIYLAFAFGISWVTALVIFLTGGLIQSPLIIQAPPITLAYLLLATAYMFGPALANVITRLITKEGTADLNLRPEFGGGRWVQWAAGWVLPGLLTLLGLVIFFIVFPRHFDPSFPVLREQLQQAGPQPINNLWLLITLQVIQAIILSPLLNALPTFGEEFGWRGYLQPKLMPLGGRKAVFLTGLIWGVWHWPVILMGHNYGLDYFGAPFLGPLVMIWFTLILSALFGWLTIKSNTVWPAVIAHGAVNGIAALGLILTAGNPSSLLGPAPTGLIGGLGFTLAALLIYLIPGALEPRHPE
jgi:membrane protease YdiL (CAAX protease family)